jgi:hypothetical protein
MGMRNMDITPSVAHRKQAVPFWIAQIAWPVYDELQEGVIGFEPMIAASKAAALDRLATPPQDPQPLYG